MYYKEKYFQWQKNIGSKTGLVNSYSYKEFLKEDDSVLDFGCGGGYLLDNLDVKEKYGIEINPVAREEAQKKCDAVYESIDDFINNNKNKKFDVIISCHAFEHVLEPARILEDLKKILKKEGKIIFITPIDSYRNTHKYYKEDINKHLYTWTPLLMGNLFDANGYNVQKVDTLRPWMPFASLFVKIIPKPVYKLLSCIFSYIYDKKEVRIIATI